MKILKFIYRHDSLSNVSLSGCFSHTILLGDFAHTPPPPTLHSKKVSGGEEGEWK